MKYCTYVIIALCSLLMIWSCGGDDDICESGEGTPRIKVAFKSQSTGKEVTLDSLYVAVDYGSGKVQLGKLQNINSRLIPLRVDDSPYTDVYFRFADKGVESHVRVGYTTKTTYVSPGCGIKKTYENLNSQLIQPTPVISIEAGLNQIENEDKTNLFLLF
ncbi:DUF6452 family protein [Chryseobacterium kwangjuense]|uniref:Uncharacterized protein n=1 Tax=Chryseobacterium kwangjuense TaxID=267125 RepID=A0A135WLW9_9FLAO|nr:DUF6452 family protein [Chryseobacterium kwangjuense]KXH85910.1 hypothetical protein AU378_09310 [Chryseobacterium kwangjuense]